MNKDRVIDIFYYFIIGVLFFVLHSASIDNLHFFAIGMLVALIWIDCKPVILTLLYIAGGFFTNFNLLGLGLNSLTCVIILFYYYTHVFIKKPLNYFSLGFMGFISQIGKIVLLVLYPEVRLSCFLEIVLSIIVLYCFVIALQCFKLKGLKNKYLCDEILSIGVLVFSVAVGLGSVYPYFVYYFVFALGVLLISHTLSPISGLVFSVMYGLGGACYYGDFLMLSTAVGVGSVAAIVTNEKKILSSCGVVLSFILFSMFFNTYFSEMILLSFLFGGIFFALLPKKVVVKLGSFVVHEPEIVATKVMVNQTRDDLKNSLLRLSDVFLDMKNMYYSLGRGEDFESIVVQLGGEVKKRACLNCVNRNKCLNNIDQSIIDMLRLCHERGRLSLLDSPPNLCAGCSELGLLIATVNDINNRFKEKSLKKQGNKGSMITLGNHCGEISSILTQGAMSLDEKVSFDTILEQRIKENLSYARINCLDVVAFQKNNVLKKISLTIPKRTNLKRVREVLYASTHTYFDEDYIEIGVKAGYKTITYQKCAQYDVLYGCYGVTKQNSKISGDTYSVTKLNKSRVLIAISDGMGTGQDAHIVSEKALNTLEDFFYVGLESEFSINSVNKLLLKRGEEIFSALDLGIIDLERGRLSLIKLGSAFSFIIRKDEITKIEPASMPLGMLDEMKTNILNFTLVDEDYIVLVSDGVVDAFPNNEVLEQTLRSLPKRNPQIMAQILIEEALKFCDNAKDDMTALVIRIVKKLR